MQSATLWVLTPSSCRLAMVRWSSVTASAASPSPYTSLMCFAMSPSVVFSSRALTSRAAISLSAFSARGGGGGGGGGEAGVEKG
jgi:hypothetical protein